MALGFIARAMQAGLAKLGEPSFLDGLEIGKVNIERNVDMYAADSGRADDNHIAQADVAVLPPGVIAAVGQVLQHPDGRYKLMRKLDDTGYGMHFIIVPSPP